MKLSKRIANAGPGILVCGFMVWLLVAVYSGSLNPVSQVSYVARDMNCKLDGGLDWEAGENGCYRTSSNALMRFRRAFGGN